MDLKVVYDILSRYDYQKSSIISILQDIQSKLNYLPREVLIEVSKCLDIPLTVIYGIVTFYKAFYLKPKGRHTIQVCLGTACHVRGGRNIVDYLESFLNIKSGETTADLCFSLDTVNCLGACALGPLLVIDGRYYGKMETVMIENILEKYK